MVGSRFLYNNVSLGGGAIAISGPNPLLEIIDSLFYGNGIYTGTLYPPSLFLPPPSSPLFPITSSLQRCALCSKPLKMIISCVLFSFPFILKGWQLVHSLNIFFFFVILSKYISHRYKAHRRKGNYTSSTVIPLCKRICICFYSHGFFTILFSTKIYFLLQMEQL